ncbi:ABC transporter substrate-binding protein [Actinoplanes ianthinogenes]|uniref:ABC transporter substrate-binding protein n=1 Tax=Actinoplanes ianthinogenes TaxID=122358 RepID=A0ABM7M6H8_9ACTN|nr:ABC transporter substrate-binding protein [Actinoplanes ianthinogenes]BCJ47247.1 ABC transporter substrate-binding protein [Actinoplanes ianthinogenes]GGR42494.1 ABC transporter substrate-binding protein [Actinoplanes ianthinogenes]
MRRPIALVTALLALTTAAGCAQFRGDGDDADVKPEGAAAADNGKPKVTFRYQSGASYGSIAPFELATKLGYYEGTSVQIKSVGISKSGPEDIQAIAAGSNDIAWTNTAPIIHADVSGLKIKAIVAAGTTLTKDTGGKTISIGGLLAKKSSGITTAKDLEGKKVSVNVRSAQAEYAIRKWAEAGGADPEKIDYVVVAPPNEIQALQQGQVDAAYSWTPAYNKGQEDPGIKVVATEGDMLGDFVTGGFAFSQQFLDAHPEAVKEFVAGYVKAWSWAWEHPAELQEKAAAIITDFKGNADLAKYVYPFGSRPNALIKDADIQFYIDQLTKKGELTAGQVKPTDFYTNDYNPYAKS